MKKVTVLAVFLMGCALSGALANPVPPIDREQLVEALRTLDTNIVGYFPRWKVCEYDLQIQIEQIFKLHGYPSESLDKNNIIITAAPKPDDDPYLPYELLLIECGSSQMVASEIDANMESLSGIISGEIVYSGPDRGFINDYGNRTYCFIEIPIEVPLSQSQHEVITNYLEPTNVTHSFALSAFDQSVKIGESGFWLRSSLGTDPVGYHFWSSGEASITFRRPLYENADPATRVPIPHLIHAWVGGGYRLTTGLEDGTSGVLDWVKDRRLNAGPGGKLIAGLNFHAPMHPQAGIHFNIELPLVAVGTNAIDASTYAKFDIPRTREVFFEVTPEGSSDPYALVPILRATGQVTAFYHWWVDPKHPENYFRFDAGISYAEVREAALFDAPGPTATITGENVVGLKTYKNRELGDWVFLKAEYRSQAAFPFGLSAQYSNQIFLGRVYVPVFGRFLYMEGKYATPLRHTRYFETKHFFMISPVVRLTI